MSDLKIFTNNIEQSALQQINTLLDQEAFKDCKVRIMPDVHAGSGCVIGFTANLGDKVIPNIVGVDIGCGMNTTYLGDVNIDLVKLDNFIKENIPYGKNVNEKKIKDFRKLKDLKCYNQLHDVERIEKSIGSLGGGNHFIEIDKDEHGLLYLVIHSGSRNLGTQVAKIYQELAISLRYGKDKLLEEQQKLIDEYKAQGREKEISKAIKELATKFQEQKNVIPKELCYLTGRHRDDYLHDMKICQEYASLNRHTMAEKILKFLGMSSYTLFETIHNYISFEDNVVRKGAISAKKGEMVLIPINMRDGCIIGIGKGNEDWNNSAPHGAGRIMSRNQARTKINLGEYKETMKDIYTTSVCADTIDEAPMVYKPLDEIVENIKDTVEIIKIIKPIYNFKATE